MPPEVKSWKAADAGQRRGLGRTVTGRSAMYRYMYHRVTTCAFLRGLILLLRRPTGRGSFSTMRDCSSVASRVCDRFRQSSLYPIDLTYSKETLNTYLSRGICWFHKISATLSCPMKLQKYPLDTQICPMMFESFGYTMDVMYFSWLHEPVEIDSAIQLPQFQLKDHVLYECSQNYTGGAFPCLEIRFILRRDVGYFLIQIYVPSMLIVILSWVSFWINVDASPARVSIGLLTVLTTTTQSTGINSALPKVSYIKAIDVWMSVCLVFVFTALLEYAVVNVLARRRGVRILHSIPRPQFGLPIQQLQQPPPKENANAESQLDQINIIENGADRRQPPRVVDPEGKHKARQIDKISRKMFPLAFALFNLVYWTMYTLPFTEDDDNDV